MAFNLANCKPPQLRHIALNQISLNYKDQVMISDSVESLDSYLPRLQRSNFADQLDKEQRIYHYLKDQKVQFKTDPRKKELEYYEKQKYQQIVLQNIISDEYQEVPEYVHFSPVKRSGEAELNTWLNPVKSRRNQLQI